MSLCLVPLVQFRGAPAVHVCCLHEYTTAGNPYWRGKISTIDLLVLTSSNQLLLILKLYFSHLQNNLSYCGGQSYWAFPFSKGSLATVFSLSYREWKCWLFRCEGRRVTWRSQPSWWQDGSSQGRICWSGGVLDKKNVKLQSSVSGFGWDGSP